MLRRFHLCLVSAAVLSILSAPCSAQAASESSEASSLSEIFTKGEFSSQLRLRYETVDDDRFDRDADAATVRFKTSFRTAPLNGFSAYVESESVYALIEDYNSTANGRTQYPVVADPDGSEFNQAYVAYGYGTPTQVVVGRQKIAYGNQRFFGSVSFRQNEQTFDAASLKLARGGLVFDAAYVAKVHRIFGNSNPNRLLRQQSLDAVLLNAAYKFGEQSAQPLRGGSLSAYAYFVENEDLALSSAKTMGLRYAGTAGENGRWFYAAEFARQSDYRQGDPAIDHDYTLLEGGLKFDNGRYSVKIGQETLGGDGSSAFQTPFATLHAFNGWVDRFLRTPADGLRDRYLVATAKLGPGTLAVQWHQYHSDSNRRKFGRELGAQYAWPVNKQLKAVFKTSSFEGDALPGDIWKSWLFLDYKL